MNKYIESLKLTLQLAVKNGRDAALVTVMRAELSDAIQGQMQAQLKEDLEKIERIGEPASSTVRNAIARFGNKISEMATPLS